MPSYEVKQVTATQAASPVLVVADTEFDRTVVLDLAQSGIDTWVSFVGAGATSTAGFPVNQPDLQPLVVPLPANHELWVGVSNAGAQTVRVLVGHPSH